MILPDPSPVGVVRTPPPVPRWVAPVFAVAGLATIPWTIYLAATLPDQTRNHNYRVAWVGFDVMLVLALLLTAFFAWRGTRVVGLLAASTSTMLVLDAWFDVTTSPHREVVAAVGSAFLLELPLAVVCGWIAMHVDQVVGRSLRRAERHRPFRLVVRLRPRDRRTGPTR